MSNFLPVEIVGRGSETQLQVSENLNDLIQRCKGRLTNIEQKYLVTTIFLCNNISLQRYFVVCKVD